MLSTVLRLRKTRCWEVLRALITALCKTPLNREECNALGCSLANKTILDTWRDS
jgi:hypothetical protein